MSGLLKNTIPAIDVWSLIRSFASLVFLASSFFLITVFSWSEELSEAEINNLKSQFNDCVVEKVDSDICSGFINGMIYVRSVENAQYGVSERNIPGFGNYRFEPGELLYERPPDMWNQLMQSSDPGDQVVQ